MGCCGPKKEGGLHCPITGCPVKQVMIGTILAFVTILAGEWAYHSLYMMPLYQETAALWRNPEEMQHYTQFNFISVALRALAFAGLFCWAGKSCGGICCPVKGIKFGLLAGLLVGAYAFGSYAWLPLPSIDIPLRWLAGDVVIGMATGLVLALGSRCCKKGSHCTRDETNGSEA